MARILVTVALLAAGLLTLSADVRAAHAGQPTKPAAGNGSSLSEAAPAIIDAMNGERTAAGLPALTPTTDVEGVAVARAAALSTIGFLSHADPAGQDAATLLDQSGIPFKMFGENLGLCNGSVADVAATLLEAWMESPDHRANILDLEFSRAGISVVGNGSAIYAVVVFLD